MTSKTNPRLTSTDKSPSVLDVIKEPLFLSKQVHAPSQGVNASIADVVVIVNSKFKLEIYDANPSREQTVAKSITENSFLALP